MHNNITVLIVGFRWQLGSVMKLWAAPQAAWLSWHLGLLLGSKGAVGSANMFYLSFKPSELGFDMTFTNWDLTFAYWILTFKHWILTKRGGWSAGKKGLLVLSWGASWRFWQTLLIGNFLRVQIFWLTNRAPTHTLGWFLLQNHPNLLVD